MKKILRLSILAGALAGSYSFYTNYIKTPPAQLSLSGKQKKKVVVVGGGIVGLSTAYFLSKDKDTDVVLVEKHPKCAQECSIQNGCLLMRYNAIPWTYKPLISILKGIWRSD